MKREKIYGLWIDHDKVRILWGCSHENRHDRHEERRTLSAAYDASCKHVRRFGQIADDGVAVFVCAEGDLQIIRVSCSEQVGKTASSTRAV